MVNPAVLRLLRSPNPPRAWHSGELETSMVLAAAPGLVRRAAMRGLRPVWVEKLRRVA